MFHIQLKNAVSANAGDLLLIGDDGTVSVSRSLPINEQTIHVKPLRIDAPLFDAKPVARHHYKAPRKCTVRTAEQIKADRDRILNEAIRRSKPFTPAEGIRAFYTGHVPGNDRRATNVRDDLRLLANTGLLQRVSDDPLMYSAAEGPIAQR